MSLQARSVLITGASRGIGLELIRHLLKQPSVPEIIIACCRNPGDAQELADIAKRQPGVVHVVKLDVVCDEDIDNAVKSTEKLVGERGLNVLINNAGICDNKADGGRLRIQTRERMRKLYEVNTISPIIISQKFLPLLQLAANQHTGSLSASRSAIVMIGSILGSQTNALTFPDYSKDNLCYRCSKTAIHMASVLMSRDLKDDGILVMSVHPGWVRTALGGADADVSVEQSAKGCLKVIDQAGESEHGRLVNYLGEILEF